MYDFLTWEKCDCGNWIDLEEGFCDECGAEAKYLTFEEIEEIQ